MRYSTILLAALFVVAGCKQEEPPVSVRSVRTMVVDPKALAENRQAIGEVKPRYESDLSFRVPGKLISRLVDVGASVKKGATLGTLDTPDYQNRLRSAVAEASAAEAALVEARGTEGRLGKLLKDGWTPQATYDSALRNLRSAEAKLAAERAALELARDQLSYTELKADFDGIITAVGAEAGQNVAAGQMVVKLARPNEKDGVFNIAETALIDFRDGQGDAIVWPLSNQRLTMEGRVREISPVADATTRTYTVKVTLKEPPPQVRFGMSVGGRWKSSPGPVVALPASALFQKGSSPAVWLLDPQSGGLKLQLVTIARYEADSVIIADGLVKGDVVVTAGINTLREGEKVRVAGAVSPGRNQP
jgi:RND family efflux transporter MFP subunit